jgi:pimeloyl-ACP methyl ester carboxylesterase
LRSKVGVTVPEQFTIDAPTTRLTGWSYGNTEAQPMVFLHGLSDLAWSLHPIASAFSHRFHVLSLDLRGHGDSGHPGQYSLANFVSDLHIVITEMGLEKPVLFGHSLGSIITSWYAGTWPDKPAALVMLEGLGPPPRFGENEPLGRLEIAQGLIESVATDPTRRPMIDIEAAVTRLRRAHPALAEPYLSELAELGTRVGPDGGLVWKFDPYSREWSTTFTRSQEEERWNEVRCPTLILSGSRAWERWWKQAGEMRPGPSFDGPLRTDERDRRLACFSDVEHRDVDAGHMVHFDAPDEVIALTANFLERRL